MNSQLYRIVFNAARGQAMAVAESARTHGRRAGSRSTRPRCRRHFAMSVAWLAWLGTLTLPAAAPAQIVAYRQAPAAQQPTILSAANGVPLVNIQTPSAAGVSYNAYSQFDVDGAGAIVNNARSATSTQLGGWVQGNPWLAGGSARVIVNEVISTNPSQLRGYVEIAGNRAQLVIANPAGIACSGCGFINAQRSTLTTGKPLLNGGNLDGYRVSGGTIAIDGAGMDARQTSYADLIARAVTVNAAIWAETLSVTTGAALVDAGNTRGTPIAGEVSAPRFALDVAALGGMYAGKITLVGSEAGLGVRNAGTIGASAGDLVISVDGLLHNSGQIASTSKASISAPSVDNAAGGAVAAATLELRAGDTHTLNNRGLIDGNDVLIDSPTVNNVGSGRIYGDRLAIGAQTLDNAAEAGDAAVIAARERLDIGVTTVRNSEHALIFSAGDLAIGAILDADRHASGQAERVDNRSATIEALGAMDIGAQRIDNGNAHFATTQRTLAAKHLVEYQGSGSAQRYAAGTPGVYVHNDQSDQLMTPEGNYESWLRYDYTRSTSETQVTHSEPGRIVASGDMHLIADTLTNDNSEIIAGGALAAEIGRLDNRETSGERVISDSGSVTSYWRKQRKGRRDTTDSSTAAYAPPPTIQTITLGTTVFRQDSAVGGGPVATTVALPDALAANALFRSAAPQPTVHYLIETDPRFADYRQWLSSDYLLAALAVDPASVQKRLGDGFYEQRLLREQLAQLTGQRFLAGYASDEAQYQALMNAGSRYAQRWQLIPGVALSPEQMAALTEDMVWLVEQRVTLADGTTQRALAPQLYLRASADAAVNESPRGNALIAANAVSIDATGDLYNGGAIAGRQQTVLSAGNVDNVGGRISAQQTIIDARNDLANVGGTLSAQDSLLLNAGHDLTVASTTRRQSNAQGSRSNVDRIGALAVTDGTLLASAGNDLDLIAASIANVAVGGSTLLAAGNDLRLATISQSTSQDIVWDGQNRRSDRQQSDIGSTLRTGGDLSLSAGNSIDAVAANIASDSGALALAAGKDIRVSAGQSNSQVDESHRHASRGFFSKTTRSSRDTVDQTSALASALSGQTATLAAGNDIAISGSSVIANGDVLFRSGNDLRVEAASETYRETHYREVKQSGIFSGGGIGFTIGRLQQSSAQTSDGVTAAGSLLGSSTGHLQLHAGNAYRQIGSQLVATQGNVDIDAAKVDIAEARESWRNVVETKTRQSGLTIALSSPVVSALQTVRQMRDASAATHDPRLQLLAGASSALALGNAAENSGEIKLSVSIGSSSSQSTSAQSSNRAAAATVGAGQDIRIGADGAGKDSDLTLQGAQITAGRDIALAAADEVRLLAARNDSTLHSSNKSSGASVGFSVGSDGLLVNVGASRARGSADGNATSWSDTRLTAGRQIAIESAGDTTLRGALASADRVVATVGGTLAIESLQDSERYASRQQAAGFSLSIGYGKVGGSLDVSRSRIDSDFASVQRQSGIQSGDGGFDVRVKGDAELTGALIASTQAAVDDGRNHLASGGMLQLRDIENHADYSARSSSINLGKPVSFDGSLQPGGTSAGFGKDNGSAASTTLAGISEIAGNRAVRSGDSSNMIANTFDADRVQREIDAQTQITQMFGQLAPKAIGDYAAKQLEQAGELRRLANAAPGPEQLQELEEQASALENAWGAQGTLRLAAQAVVGGLSGGVPGAAGAAAATLSAPLVAARLESAGIEGPLATTLTALAGTASGAIVGGTLGAATALDEVTNNYLYHYRGKIVAYDGNDNDKIVELSEQDLRKLAALNPELFVQLIAGIGGNEAPLPVSLDSSAQMNDSRILDIANPADYRQIATESDMGYKNLSNQETRIYVQTGMDNTRGDAEQSAYALSRLLQQPVGYINNGSDGLVADVGEYLPDSVSLRDVLNEYTYRTLDSHGPTLIVPHSAGNEDARKALQVGALYGHQYDNLAFLSIGSPVADSALQTAVTQGGARYLGQVNDWRDPVTYSKTAGVVSIGSFVGGLLGGLAYGAAQGCAAGAGGGPLGCLFAGGTGAVAGTLAGGIPFVTGYLGLKYYHPLERYIAKPQTQSILSDWIKAHPLTSQGR